MCGAEKKFLKKNDWKSFKKWFQLTQKEAGKQEKEQEQM